LYCVDANSGNLIWKYQTGDWVHSSPAVANGRVFVGSHDGYIYAFGPPSPTVGGIIVPVDKFGLLAPYIGLSSTILVATVATAVYVKHVKRRKEKQ